MSLIIFSLISKDILLLTFRSPCSFLVSSYMFSFFIALFSSFFLLHFSFILYSLQLISGYISQSREKNTSGWDSHPLIPRRKKFYLPKNEENKHVDIIPFPSSMLPISPSAFSVKPSPL
uniref:Uncharacterized protein n=1 Tax=Cacopsylla melanoneura TaxID=428564 RepID=A0A8D9BEB2_9HEMI